MIITEGHAKEHGGDGGGKGDHGDAAEFALPRILVIDEPEPTTPQRKEEQTQCTRPSVQGMWLETQGVVDRDRRLGEHAVWCSERERDRARALVANPAVSAG